MMSRAGVGGGGPLSAPAKRALQAASDRARLEHAPELRPEHLLLGLLDEPDSTASRILAEFGIPEEREHVIAAFRAADRRGGLTDADLDALAGLGIEVETVVEKVERNLGPGVLSAASTRRRRRVPTLIKGGPPFSVDVIRTIHAAIMEIKEMRLKLVGDEHLLLGLLQRPGLVSEVLADYELTYPVARGRLVSLSAR
jgi:ATP-dependent Clp protease ATP-binding subunit ClpA